MGAMFSNINYEYYNVYGDKLGDSNGFLCGLNKYPDTSYVLKYIGEEFKERITITLGDLIND